MKTITETAKIRQLMNDKQALEVRLAWELLDVFNEPKWGLIQKLRDMVVLAVSYMDAIANGPKKDLFAQKWAGWRNYAGVAENNLYNWDPGAIRFRSRHFTAHHCADWIRIFGEVLEDVEKGEADRMRKSYQAGGTYHWTKFDLKPEVLARDSKQVGAGRRRAEATHAGQVEGFLSDYSAPGLAVWGFMSGISPFAGVKKWRVMERDTTGKMDQVFGLMAGATISGTTTDNIYFLDAMCDVGLDPIFYLLPAATIVSHGHHSLLEVALPLTLNGRGDYKVGLYSTMLPDGSRAENRPQGASEIGNILNLAENHPDNHLMMVYYEGTTPTGCFLYDTPHDKGKWRNMKSVNDLMTIFEGLPPWPGQTKVVLLRNKLGIY